MNIKKIFMSLLLTSTVTLQAIPVDPRPRSIRLADGTSMSVTLVGDEHGSWAVAEDGRALRYNDAIKAYEYMSERQLAELQEARMAHRNRFALPVAKDDEVHQALTDATTAGFPIAKTVGFSTTTTAGFPISTTAGFSTSTTAGFPIAKAVGSPVAKTEGQQLPQPGQKCNNYPTIGKRHSLVILVEFQDQKFESVDDPKAYYTRQLNEPGFSDNGATGSARDFYLTASQSLFEPIFDVIGPVQLPEKMAYYGANDGGSSDAHVGRICYDAVSAADSLGLIDFTQYDLDDDGWVDNIFIYYAGYGEADSGFRDTVWPHSTDISRHEDFEPLIFQGKQVGSYACSNELRYNEDPSVKVPTGIGTFVHEFGHTLGLPDLYTTMYIPLVHHPNKWSTMASASYNNNMNTPATFSSYERFSLGWITPKILTASVSDALMLEPLTDKADAYLVPVEGSSTEYFLYENRQRESWDEYLPGHGMLIWHIDYDDEKWHSNNVNNDYAHQHIDVVEADGKADTGTMTGDAMPGSEGITEVTLRDWAGREMPESPCFVTERYDAEVENICVRFAMKSPAFTIPAPEVNIQETTAHTITIAWTPVVGATAYDVAIMKFIDPADGLISGDPSALSQAITTTDTSCTLSGLDASSLYTVAVKVYRGYASSEATTLEVQTAELPFDERKVDNVITTSISATGFVAAWDAVRDASAYDVDIYTIGYGTDATTLGYDFTDKAEGMPEGWQTSSSTYYSISGYYGESSPSLRMSKDQDYLVIAYPEKKIHSLSLWSRAQKSQGTLAAQTLSEDGTWTDAEVKALSADATTLTFTFAEPQEQVRLLYNRDGGFVCLDDITVTCFGLERVPAAGASKTIDAAAGNVSVQGLKPATTYGYCVTALNANGTRSLPSAENRLTTLEGSPEEQPADAIFGYGYTPTTSIGFEEPVSYNVAISIDNASEVTRYLDVEGKKISSVFIYPLDYTDASDYKVWLSTRLPETADGADLCTVSIDASTLVSGQLNEVLLPEAVSGARYAGYSFNINKVANDDDANAVPISTLQKERKQGVAWIAEQMGQDLAWFDYSDIFGSVVMAVRLEGEFANGGVLPVSAKEVRAVASDDAVADVTFLNLNAAAVKSVGYSYTMSSVTTTATTEVQDSHLLGLLEPFSLSVPVTASADFGRQEGAFTATSVNGHTFDYANGCTIAVTSLAKALPQHVVEEEFTGTSCGNCPRGMKGVEITESKYDDAIIIAVHAYSISDPMYIKYAYSAEGYPACYINRTSGEIDPYFGKPISQCTSTDLYGLDPYFQAALPLADAGVELLTAEWSEDGATVHVEATAEVANNLNGRYRLEFVAVGDDLHGSGYAWAQVNYFSGNTYYSDHPDLAEFVDMPRNMTDMMYRHVALQWWGGHDEYVLSDLSAGAANSFSVALDFSTARFFPHPEQYGFERSKSSLVALLIKDDGTARGEIVNAAKVAIAETPSAAIHEIHNDTDSRCATQYDLLGRPVNKNYRGLVVMGNGNKACVKH